MMLQIHLISLIDTSHIDLFKKAEHFFDTTDKIINWVTHPNINNALYSWDIIIYMWNYMCLWSLILFGR